MLINKFTPTLGWFCNLLNISIMGIGTIFSTIILMGIGMLIREKRIMERERNNVPIRIAYIVVSFGVLCLAYYYVQNNSIRINYGMNRYGNPMLLIICAFAGWELVYQVAYFVGRTTKLKKIFMYLGKNTIPIISAVTPRENSRYSSAIAVRTVCGIIFPAT